MIASSAFVLSALTMTGIYMKSNNESEQDDGYMLDFTALEEDVQNKAQEIAGNDQAESTVDNAGNDFTGELAGLTGSPDDDLDYLPMEVGSGQVSIPGLTDGIRSEADVTSDEQLAMLEEQKAAESQSQEREDKPQESSQPESGAATAAPALEQPMLPEQTFVEQGPVLEEQPVMEGQPVWEAQPETRILGFSADQGLVRPVTGDVLIPYSMDRTVYFTTLDQYKYNPATVYRVEEGTQVMACAEARVVSVFSNEEIGQAVTLDLGNGYQVVYGQLQSLNVSEGDYVSPGQIIATVAAPTIYYSLEGSNLYFLLEQDGAALDPQSMYF